MQKRNCSHSHTRTHILGRNLSSFLCRPWNAVTERWYIYRPHERTGSLHNLLGVVVLSRQNDVCPLPTSCLECVCASWMTGHAHTKNKLMELGTHVRCSSCLLPTRGPDVFCILRVEQPKACRSRGDTNLVSSVVVHHPILGSATFTLTLNMSY